ncbi:MAG: FlgD immunoglobulin-like domain containing protein [bacterium]
MPWSRETLIQLYLRGGLRADAKKEFDRLCRKDPTFSNEVTEAAQKALHGLPEDTPRTIVAPVGTPLAPRAVNPGRQGFLKLRPWIGLGLMGAALLVTVGLLMEWGRGAIRDHGRRASSNAKSEAITDEIHQVLFQSMLTPAVQEDAIGVSPSLSAAGKALVFQEGDRIYLLIQAARRESVTLSIFGPGDQLVRRLYHGEWRKGPHQIEWDGLGLSGHPTPPGVYSVVLKAGDKRQSDRLVIQPVP